MMPPDDPTWPVCAPEPCGDYRSEKWCRHVREYLSQGKDAEAIKPGRRYCVPVVPLHRQYAEVGIEPDEIAPGIAKLYLALSLAFSQNETIYDLGLWSEGEGRWIMATTVADWVRDRAGVLKECKQSFHGYADEKVIQSRKTFDKAWMKANEWKIVAEGMCLPCSEKIISGSSFGLNEVDNRGVNQIQNALNQRFQ